MQIFHFQRRSLSSFSWLPPGKVLSSGQPSNIRREVQAHGIQTRNHGRLSGGVFRRFLSSARPGHSTPMRRRRQAQCIEKALADKEIFLFFLIDHGKIVGMCHGAFFETFCLCGLTCYVSSLMTRKDLRCRGYGKAERPCWSMRRTLQGRRGAARLSSTLPFSGPRRTPFMSTTALQRTAIPLRRKFLPKRQLSMPECQRTQQ